MTPNSFRCFYSFSKRIFKHVISVTNQKVIADRICDLGKKLISSRVKIEIKILFIRLNMLHISVRLFWQKREVAAIIIIHYY